MGLAVNETLNLAIKGIFYNTCQCPEWNIKNFSDILGWNAVIFIIIFFIYSHAFHDKLDRQIKYFKYWEDHEKIRYITQKILLFGMVFNLGLLALSFLA